MNKKNRKPLFIVVLREWPTLFWIIAYMMVAGIAAWLNYSAGGDRRFTVFALCVGALCFTALVALFALIVVVARNMDSRAGDHADSRAGDHAGGHADSRADSRADTPGGNHVA
jgi:hypothetical protein